MEKLKQLLAKLKKPSDPPEKPDKDKVEVTVNVNVNLDKKEYKLEDLYYECIFCESCGHVMHVWLSKEDDVVRFVD
jgi:hypothetical protein